jgi:hypothetical protein
MDPYVDEPPETILTTEIIQETGTTVTETETANVSEKPLVVVVGLYETTTVKLQRCEGSCRTDNDCASGLQCMRRAGNEDVPGCSGVMASKQRLNFCISGSGSGTENVDTDTPNDEQQDDTTTTTTTTTTTWLPSLEVIFGVGSQNTRLLENCEGKEHSQVPQ